MSEDCGAAGEDGPAAALRDTGAEGPACGANAVAIAVMPSTLAVTSGRPTALKVQIRDKKVESALDLRSCIQSSRRVA